MTWVNIGCGPHRAPEPWINVDVVETEQIKPDVVVSGYDPLAPWDQTVERAYLGHVLEHVPWHRVVGTLRRIRARMVRGGNVVVVGPDIHRTIRYAPHLLDVVMEDDLHHQPGEPDDWEGARHHWNCYEGRLVRALKEAGFTDVSPRETTMLRNWPVVAYVNWQCAVSGRAP